MAQCHFHFILLVKVNIKPSPGSRGWGDRLHITRNLEKKSEFSFETNKNEITTKKKESKKKGEKKGERKEEREGGYVSFLWLL